MKKKLSIFLSLFLLMNSLVFAQSEASLKISTEAAGNIFFEGEDIYFSVTAENLSSEISSAEYVVKSGDKEVVKAEAEYSEGIVLPQIPFGVYDLTVSLSAEDGSLLVGGTEFSYVKKGYQVSDSVVGMCTHFAQSKGDISISKKLLSNSGVSYIRDECSWSSVETKKGVYNIPEMTDNYVDNALENGIKTLLVLDYGNALYDQGLAPYTDTGRQGFANYAKALAEHFKGRVDAYEVWNEWSGGFGNPNGESAAVYAELLKVTYTALKSVDPNIKVIAGAVHTEGTEWFREMLDAGGFDYCDGISYHPYCYPQNPDTKDYKGNIEDNYTKNLNLLREYGGEKEIWITEYGWHTSEATGNVTERQQAEYLVRSYISAAVYGVDKLFWYDFQNDGVDPTNRENEFGIIKCHKDTEVTYAAKPAYAALSAMTGIIGDAEFVKEYRPIPTVRLYHFRRKTDNKDVVVAYNSVNGKLDFKLNGKYSHMECYDMYGNPCDANAISDEPIYLIGSGFDIREIEMTERSGVSARLGVINYFDGIRGKYSGVAAAPDGGTSAWGIEENSYVSFDIDDSYMLGYDGEVIMEVTYYDLGVNSFCIEYGSSDNIKSTDYVTPLNTTAWKTAEFSITDGNFANSLDGQDFRIKTSQGDKLYFSGITIKKSVRTSNKYAKAVLSEISVFDKLSIRAGDTPTELEVVNKKGRAGWKTDISNGFIFLYGDIEDCFLYGSDKSLRIEVDYFDEGTGNFTLEYNSETDTYKDTQVISLQDTKEWKTAVFDISGMDLTGNDFRIALWTSEMGSSSEDICFGGINVINAEASEDFELDFDFEENKIKISGISDEEYIAVEILNAGKTEGDLQDINVENLMGTLAYVNMIKPDENGFFMLEFKQNQEKGAYLVRLHYPESGETVTKFLNYFDCYEVGNVRLFNRENVEIESLAGVDYVRAEADFTVYKNPVKGRVILACYDNNRLTAVDVKPLDVYAGGTASIVTQIEISSGLSENSKVKLFFIKNLDKLTAVDKPAVFE